jgi:hypothetical protein
VLASADAADGIGTMPAELQLGLICERWNALPEVGGILDQPVGLLEKMSAAVNVYNALLSEKNRGELTLTQWSKANPQAWQVLASVEQQRRKK